MKHLSLFSGIGGFDLAAQWMGWENVAHCEWNKFCQQILKYYWPQAISYEDITKTDFTIHRGNIDIVTGGFPCQPYSLAGLRKGKDDERHLWPHMLRAVREIKPRWIVGENVLGLVGWNDGMVFEEVQTDLEAEGYKVQPYLLPAAGLNAPHKRDRIWFVAYSDLCGNNSTERSERSFWKQQDKEQQWNRGSVQINGFSDEQPIANSASEGLQTSGQTNFGEFPKKNCTGLDNRFEQFGNDVTSNDDDEHANGKRCKEQLLSEKPDEPSWICGFRPDEAGDYWRNFPTQSPVCNGNDGISSRLDAITFSKWRNESIKGGGNAIVPQVALQIFKAIQTSELSPNNPINVNIG